MFLSRFIAIFVLLTSTSFAKTGEDAKRHPYYQFKKNHHEQSIGKVYMGREIAKVMGFAGMQWLERESREKEEAISQMVAALPLKAGMQLADIGAGSGVIAFEMARKVMPGGKVFAVDIQVEMLRRLQEQVKKKGIRNIKPVLGGVEDPKLAKESVDLALMVDVYHELSHPYEMMLALSRALKSGGWLVLVEYRGEDPKVPIKELHKMTLEQLRKETSLPEFSLRWDRVDARLPLQHMVFLRKTSGNSKEPPSKS
ncbi:MAG: class I SAM-dependent methyltransferase [Oligoflexus sp.]